jgi:hypothetical protein
MGQEQNGAAAEVEPGSEEHRELNHQLMQARRRLLGIEWGNRDRWR